MQSVNECYKIVKKDCLKFINSQENKAHKFKSKERMIKLYLIPLCFWIIKNKNKNKSLFIGLSGGQGSGKTTISFIVTLILRKYFKISVFKISIDDFYKTRKDRLKLSKKVHPLLITRGVPGTHDINMVINFFKKIRNRNFRGIKLPKFNKAIDDRTPKSNWYSLKKRPEIIIFEGWCVGARPQKEYQLKKSLNKLEKVDDHNLKWRKYVNYQLSTKYKQVFKYLDYLVYLNVKNFKLLQQWRLKQENKLRLYSKNKKNLKVMSNSEVIKFMQTYQRITQNMFNDAPNYASIVLDLNSNHQIKSVKFNK